LISGVIITIVDTLKVMLIVQDAYRVKKGVTSMPFELPKSWKILMALGSALLLLAWGAAGVRGQEGSGEGQGPFEEVPIITTASRVVGIGSYVAAEAYAVPAGEDPAAQPMQAIIMPYGIDPDMQVNQIDDFTQPAPAVEGFTFAWSLAAPDGSTAPASLIQGTVGIFMADVEGRYDLTLTATDAGGTTASTVWTVYATTYVGVGGLDGQYPQFSQCSFCQHIHPRD
jgi:hypothetical protein